MPNDTKDVLWIFIMAVIGLFVVAIFTCSENKSTPTGPVTPPAIQNSAALEQLLNTETVDYIVSADIRDGIAYEVSTVSDAFRYGGDGAVPVSVVRAMVVWHEIDGKRILVGTAQGSISKSADMEETVNFLEPGSEYYFWTNWDNDPFDTADAFYTNVFAIKGSDSEINLNKLTGKLIRWQTAREGEIEF